MSRAVPVEPDHWGTGCQFVAAQRLIRHSQVASASQHAARATEHRHTPGSPCVWKLIATASRQSVNLFANISAWVLSKLVAKFITKQSSNLWLSTHSTPAAIAATSLDRNCSVSSTPWYSVKSERSNTCAWFVAVRFSYATQPCNSSKDWNVLTLDSQSRNLFQW